MILVTVGTHHQPFDRLVRAAAELALSERVVVQRGTSRVDPAGCEVHDWMTPQALGEFMGQARLVVCHAGPATIDQVVRCGTIPVVVPRRRLWREHVDDHQLHWARRIADRVHVVDDPGQLADAVADHDAVVEGLGRAWQITEPTHWIAALDAVVARRVR